MDTLLKNIDQSEIQKRASREKAMSEYGGSIVNGVLFIEPLNQSCPGDGILWQAQCTLCNTPLETTAKRARRGNPCSCQRPDVLRRKAYEARVGEHFGQLVFLGVDGKRGKHIMGLFQCDCDGKVVKKRIAEVFNGSVSSCGCVQKVQQEKNLALGGKNSRVMGTNLKRIARSDTDVAANNTSGYTGVCLSFVYTCVSVRFLGGTGLWISYPLLSSFIE